MEAARGRVSGERARQRRRRDAARVGPRCPEERGAVGFGAREPRQDGRAGRARPRRGGAAVDGRREEGAELSAIDTNHFRDLLLEERARVVAALENLHDDHPGSISDETGEDAVYDNHLADTATETYDRELDYTLEENSEHVLADIDAALKRIDDGTYGTCTNCGKPIAPERLEARPWATLCIDCQREQERG
jgi:RNA polymerase-binding protein DksA